MSVIIISQSKLLRSRPAKTILLYFILIINDAVIIFIVTLSSINTIADSTQVHDHLGSYCFLYARFLLDLFWWGMTIVAL